MAADGDGFQCNRFFSKRQPGRMICRTVALAQQTALVSAADEGRSAVVDIGKSLIRRK